MNKIVVLVFLLLFVIQLLVLKANIFKFPTGKYLVIGNCSSCYPRNAHQIVNDFDGTVIVFNNNKTFVQNKNVIMVNSMILVAERFFGMTRKNDTFVKVPTVLLNEHISFFSLFLLFNWIVRFMSGVETKILNAPDVYLSGNRKILSSGLRVITVLMANRCNQVYFFGFNHNDASQTSDYRTLGIHDFDHENKLLEQFQKTKRLIKLN